MYNNSLNRIRLLWLIEWKKRATVILGVTALSMLLMFSTILLEAQRLRLSPPFFTIHFFIGVFILIGIQIATLFPEWRSTFQSAQYLQTPATAWEKYLSRLSFPLIVGPGIYSVAFFLCRPLCLQFSLAMKDFMLYPVYDQELPGLIVGSSLFSISLFALFIPGSIWFNRTHLIKSLLIYLALLFSIALISAMSGFPMYETTEVEGSFIERMLGAQTQGLFLFFSKYILIWYGIIGSIMLLSGYYLLKYREV